MRRRSSSPKTEYVQVVVQTSTKMDRFNRHVCFHTIQVQNNSSMVMRPMSRLEIKSVKIKMPGQGFKKSMYFLDDPPFELQLGPCWGLPHVTIDVLFDDGTLKKSVFSDNLPSHPKTFDIPVDMSPSPTCVRDKSKDPASVSLHALREGNKKVVARACSSLHHHGFCFLSFDRALDPHILHEAPKKIHAYLKKNDASEDGDATTKKGEGDFDEETLTGHITTKFKNTLRVLSGDYLKDDIEKIPHKIRDTVLSLCEELDTVQLDVVRSLAMPLLKCKFEKVAEKFDIPLLKSRLKVSKGADSIRSKGWRAAWKEKEKTRYGLVDCVLYRMSGMRRDKETAVDSHVDPGLFVLSLPQLGSTGLEMQAADGKWISPPKYQGVLWTGSAAVISGCAGGQHRVKNVKTDERFSCWHELCTSKQIHAPMLRRIRSEGVELSLGSIHGTTKVLRALRKAEDHDDDDDVDLHRSAVPRRLGMPMSKSGAFHYDFRNVKPILETTAGYGRKQIHRALDQVSLKTRERTKKSPKSKAQKIDLSIDALRHPIKGMPLSKIALPSFPAEIRPWSEGREK